MAGSLVDEADGTSLVDPTPRLTGVIYLMRHGHTVLDVDKRSDGFLDFPLSDKGRLGVIEAQQYLKTVPLSYIRTAPLKRTVETAEIVKSGTVSDPKIQTDDDGRTWNLGILAGTAKKISKPLVRELMANPTQRPPSGESYNEFLARFIPWFEKNCTAPVLKNGKPILYVGSGSNLRALGQNFVSDMDALDLDEGGLAMLYFVGNGPWQIEVILGEDDSGDQVS
ncbi:MAG: histidine phosphatase family protein [Patescibacteria group bacterium]|nr:histidine phosphatase family protein [Patescibacteria group bacterium]